MAAVMPLRKQDSPVPIETLVGQLVTAKRDEDAAKARRMSLEEQVAAALGCPEEGSKTEKVGDYRVTITGKLTYKADVEQLVQLAQALPADLRPIKTTTALDETGAKWLRGNRPDLWAIVAPALTVSPAKTAVKVGL